MADSDPLKGLQDWYCSQCNGDWEHGYGVSIEKLDNPGWSLKIELKETSLSDRALEEVAFGGEDKNDWYRCRVRGRVFEAYCRPTRLSDVITIFLNWAN
jgi:hypothetical protein